MCTDDEKRFLLRKMLSEGMTPTEAERAWGCAARRLGVIVAVAVLAAPLGGCGQPFVSGDSQAQAGEEGVQQADSYEDEIAWRFYPGSGGDDTREVVCWGDSMTQGVGADADGGALVSLADGEPYDTSAQPYPQVLSQLTGLDTYNFGVAGAASEEIAAMQGGLPWTEIEIADDGDEADATSDAEAEDGDVADDEGEDSDAADGQGEQAIRRIDPEVIEEGEEHTGDILVLEIGSNGDWGDDYQVLIDQYRAMIERSGCEDYLILGDTDDPGTSVGDTSQVPFTEDYAPRETNWEAALREAFGDHFINMRVFLIRHGLEISGLTPTEEDVADARLGCISKQLRSDWTHLNAHGYFAKAVAVYQRGVKLGYWSPGEGSIDVARPQRHQAHGAGQG
ncbi:hypothetical protein [Olsenella sp. oral taxon 809]|uniref:hypothetical protein n=1 Tax=Olsenella sp. oral taxon 809 TaxID=661086 RepID=UPI000231F068|nr:hypothetical protein [Olsenella sp. oral taxon 809]EHF02127.1 hypothetical protein HMPREF1008_00946 [Olsenella sp. oral taxon 809 str. F0356]